ncbi:hypothetical protein RO3G_15562 [Rhizopus delemar RA 99-880]|uniref:Isoleucine--tRNA ligase, mitochondrial n=1 Tax=Rhizopus delemar (strain RA 99-880 / ATCC MYA-4621 / FGSC 9543 / NRRL 43880) TaxID=246409 RepID=I1CQX1_RHIO9|nr:hypothetical protein RO3G_15562 [Rhizopus delemar RA 99-880]|eukprot:EIE90851.1 hypothetical protein RO3G_15562 [Rhizopus delemar RA 99-880]
MLIKKVSKTTQLNGPFGSFPDQRNVFAHETKVSFYSSTGLKAKENPYTKTLLLPKTSFPLRANAATREHLFRDRCTKDLYPWQLKNNPKDTFILHDGPPYANGNVHAGHALNKIVKDIINRHKLLQGHKIYYRPGWDCHGLPIELKALEQIRQNESTLSAVEIRKLAKSKALFEVDKQKKDFMSWGIMGDWENPYLTLTKDFEMRQLVVLREMIKKGYIYRQLKPVYWSPSSKSALAEAELEYKENHVSTSLYVQFPIKVDCWKDKQVHALIWTTTPWTLPSNRAICVHPELDYHLVQSQTGQHWIIGKDRLEALQEELDQRLTVLDTVKGSALVGSSYQHPISKEQYPVLAGKHVTAESGTALVHTAPGHGLEDYEVCLANNIQPFSWVDEEGKFTSEAGPQFEGKFAFREGNETVIELLDASIVKKSDYTHKYPYDWRTKQPVMLRATAQWFANVEDLQKKATSINHIIQVLTEKGTDAWWEEEDDLVFVAPEYRQDGKIYKRGYDTMDVWFDSGTSWTMLQGLFERDLSKPVADVYLEGSDQHRGWFQSSLLTSNEKGDKMSKSLGNTIEPILITAGGKDKKKNPAYGSDVLRLWVANCDYTKDMTIGPSIIATISDHLRKIRTTARFLLGNLHDFDLKHYVDYNHLQEIDQYMLHELYKYNHNVTTAMDDYSFNKAVQHVQNFTNNTLSSFYFDVIKDRLYNESQSALSRRMAQTVLYEVLKSYTTSISPFVCHTAEEIYENYRQLTPAPQSSVFKTGWLYSDDKWNNTVLNEKWSMLLNLKSEVNQIIESIRQEKQIRTSQEVDVSIVLDNNTRLAHALQSLQPSELSDIFMTSHVYINQSIEAIKERESTIEEFFDQLANKQSSDEEWHRLMLPYKQEKQTLKELEDQHDLANTELVSSMNHAHDTLSNDIHQHQHLLMTEQRQYEAEKAKMAQNG